MSIKKDFADVSKENHIAYYAVLKYKSVKKNKKIAEKTRNLFKTINALSCITCNEQAEGQGTRDKAKKSRAARKQHGSRTGQDRTGRGNC